MVVGIVGAFAGLAKVRYEHTNVDSQVFRFHYRWTAAFCFLACALVTASEYIGDPILCMEKLQDADKPINTYCWISSTFSLNTSITDRSSLSHLGNPNNREKRYHSYYQWVHVVLFIQGVLFYLPHLLWKMMEGKQVDNLLQGMNKTFFAKDKEAKKGNIASYLRESWGLNQHYAHGYLLCEVLNLVNVVGQLFLIDKFLGGFFLNYGTQVIQFFYADDSLRVDPLIKTFPRTTKCTFHQVGDSGTVEHRDYLCVLPQNIMNEKVFLVMWLWFVCLAVVTAFQVVWQMLVLYSPQLRVMRIKRYTNSKFNARTEQALLNLHTGDWCLLLVLAQNLDPLTFNDILTGLAATSRRYAATAPTLHNYRNLDDSNLYPTLPSH